MDDGNNCYRLYKLVFNNIYLTNIIYNNVKSYRNYEVKYGYYEAPFYWIVNNNHCGLIKFKIKSCSKLSNFSYRSLIKLFQLLNANEDEDIINQFYKTNRDGLMNTKYQHVETNLEDIGILSMAIYCQNFQFLKLIHQDLKTNKLLSKLPKSTQQNALDISFINGNLEIIKYVYDEIGIKDFNCEMLLYNSLCSDNRNKVIDFILSKDCIDFIPVKRVPHYESLHRYNFYIRNLLKLEISLFSRLYELGIIGELINETEFSYQNRGRPYLINEFITHFNKIIVNSSTETFTIKTEEFNQFINSLKVSLLFIYIRYRDKRYLVSLKKINHLIKYQDSNQQIPQYNTIDDYFYTLNASNDYINIQAKEIIEPPKPESSIYSLFSNFLKGEKQSISIPTKKTIKLIDNQEIKHVEHLNLKGIIQEVEPIRYSNFDFQREIKRIYLFDFLKDDKIDLELIKKREWSMFVIDFASKYKEYELIEKIKTNVTRSSNEDDFSISYDLNICHQDFIMVSMNNSDSELINITNNLMIQSNTPNSFKQISSYLSVKEIESSAFYNSIFNINTIPIDIQIQYFEKVCHNIQLVSIKSRDWIFQNILSNMSLTIDQLLKIAEIIQQYYKNYQYDTKFHSKYFSNNRLAYDFFLANYKPLFIWEYNTLCLINFQ